MDPNNLSLLVGSTFLGEINFGLANEEGEDGVDQEADAPGDEDKVEKDSLREDEGVVEKDHAVNQDKSEQMGSEAPAGDRSAAFQMEEFHQEEVSKHNQQAGQNDDCDHRGESKISGNHGLFPFGLGQAGELSLDFGILI
jgi:hypothetical protein